MTLFRSTSASMEQPLGGAEKGGTPGMDPPEKVAPAASWRVVFVGGGLIQAWEGKTGG